MDEETSQQIQRFREQVRKPSDLPKYLWKEMPELLAPLPAFLIMSMRGIFFSKSLKEAAIWVGVPLFGGFFIAAAAASPCVAGKCVYVPGQKPPSRYRGVYVAMIAGIVSAISTIGLDIHVKATKSATIASHGKSTASVNIAPPTTKNQPNLTIPSSLPPVPVQDKTIPKPDFVPGALLARNGTHDMVLEMQKQRRLAALQGRNRTTALQRQTLPAARRAFASC